MNAILAWIKKILITLVVLTVLVLSLWMWGALKFIYSTGERAGYVQKFSQRGWLFKTWEGELAMVNLPGAMPEIFKFSVFDPKVPPKLQSTMGERVVLKYEQHRFLPLPIFAETEYFIVDVLPVKDSSAPPPLPASPAH